MVRCKETAELFGRLRSRSCLTRVMYVMLFRPTESSSPSGIPLSLTMSDQTSLRGLVDDQYHGCVPTIRADVP